MCTDPLARTWERVKVHRRDFENPGIARKNDSSPHQGPLSHVQLRPMTLPDPPLHLRDGLDSRRFAAEDVPHEPS